MPIRKVPGGWKVEGIKGIMHSREVARKRLAAIKTAQKWLRKKRKKSNK